MNEQQRKRIDRLRGMVARRKFDEADSLLDRELTLTAEQKTMMRDEVAAARKGSVPVPVPVPVPPPPPAAPRSPSAATGGAQQLPQAHLSVRVPWHDTDWTGRICADPAANHWCTVLRNVHENKNPQEEAKLAGSAWSDIDESKLPPCVVERGGFMRKRAFKHIREHAYAKSAKSHAHFAPTWQQMPPFSVEAIPFRWTRRGDALAIAANWGIGYDPHLEEEADRLLGFKRPTIWIQDHRNQTAMLDSFFSAVVPNGSLVFFYAKDIPLLELAPAGTRVLIGVGRVRDVGPRVEWQYSGPGPLRSIMWERAVGHSIRPDFADGFLLPYQQLTTNPALQGDDLSKYVAIAPPEHFEEFSNVSELVSNDAAIASLLELSRVVELLPGVTDGPWPTVSVWLSDRIAEVWERRGPFPGLGSALVAAGIEHGGRLVYDVTNSLPENESDPWPYLGRAIAGAGRVAKNVWNRIESDPRKLRLLRLISRFPLTVEQAKRAYTTARPDAVLDNPYIIFEDDRGHLDSIALATIDRGLFPQSADATAALAKYPLPEPVVEAADDRRVRAACAYLLDQAVGEGHTLLDEPTLRRRLAALPLEPVCDPSSEAFEVASDTFDPVLRLHFTADSDNAWQLERLSTVSDLITSEVQQRSRGGALKLRWDWRAQVDSMFDEPAAAGDTDEEPARAEKAVALETLATSRFAALIGPAGTGKSTLVNALCTHADIKNRGVLLLAPTGKARVQLGERAKTEAQTLAQFLRRHDRWDDINGYQVRPDRPKVSGFATVIVDEASMLTEEMLAALLDCVVGAERVILCGDHRQLPPIGAGRPFFDIIAFLRNGVGPGSGIGMAELTIGRRAVTLGKASRDDLRVASLFSIDGAAPAADEALARVLENKGDGTISIRTWTDADSLAEVLYQLLESESRLDLVKGSRGSLRKSLGATGEYNGHPAFVRSEGGKMTEAWQLLSPLRARDGGVSTLNDLVRDRYRPGDLAAARNSKYDPWPLGSELILKHDKVICIRNHQRQLWRPSTREKHKISLANGEMGMVTQVKSGNPIVEFAGRKDAEFTFYTSEFGDLERGEFLELAYAVTIHKSQGSQFGVTLVVVPQPCALLSPELLYTALTRQQQRTYLLLQGTADDLWELIGPERSENARRLTRLFHEPDPFTTASGGYMDAGRVHKTAAGELVRSKSEVIVANTLRHLGVDYVYEQRLTMPDGTWRLPDFTIYRTGRPTVYWEHLGMLNSPGYRADWKAKKQWYLKNQILPFDQGTGTNGVLVESDEGVSGRGIEADVIEETARKVFDG